MTPRISVDPLSSTLFALADPTRRGILAQLAKNGDATVNELAAPYEMSLAAVSKHLKVLESAGLISRGRDAQRRPCHLEGKPLQAVSLWLEDYRQFWERSMDSLADYLVMMQREREQPPEPAAPKKIARTPKRTSRARRRNGKDG